MVGSWRCVSLVGAMEKLLLKFTARSLLQKERLSDSPRLEKFIGKKVSVSTVRRSLNDSGLYGRVARRKPLLNDKHRRKRLDFAKRYQSWTSEDWKKVIFSDESRFQLFYSNGRTYVRRRKGEEFNENCVVSTVKHGGGSVMVWGCFSAD